MESIQARDGAMRQAYVAAQSSFPAHSQPPGGLAVDATEANRKRLLYRSRQRGWLEVDLLLGTWAAKNLPGLTAGELDAYEAILNQETTDLYNLLLSKPEVAELGASLGPMMTRIQTFVNNSPLGKAADAARGYAGVKGIMSN